MSHAPQPDPAADARQAPADVARSLFWDDVRTGLKVVSVGMILVLVGELCIPFHTPTFLSGSVLLVGGLLCLLGLGVSTAIPKETGVRTLALASAGCAALGLLALVADLFSFFDLP